LQEVIFLDIIAENDKVVAIISSRQRLDLNIGDWEQMFRHAKRCALDLEGTFQRKGLNADETEGTNLECPKTEKKTQGLSGLEPPTSMCKRTGCC
jgi:hypothetical protein